MSLSALIMSRIGDVHISYEDADEIVYFARGGLFFCVNYEDGVWKYYIEGQGDWEIKYEAYKLDNILDYLEVQSVMGS